MLFFWRLVLTVIKSAIRMLVNLNVTLAPCGSLASTVSERENEDDAFFFTHLQLFRQSMIGGKIKPIPNTNQIMWHRQCIIYMHFDYSRRPT